MRTVFPELKKLQPGDTAIIGCDPESGEIEWTVSGRQGSILELVSRRPVTKDWLSQHGEEMTDADIARLLREVWLPERLDRNGDAAAIREVIHSLRRGNRRSPRAVHRSFRAGTQTKGGG